MEKLNFKQASTQFYEILNDLKYWKCFYKKCEFEKSTKTVELESKLLTLDERFSCLFIEFEKNWRNWNTKDICQWIKILKNHQWVDVFSKLLALTLFFQRYAVDTILFIEPILEAHKITGKHIESEQFLENFVKTKILIGEPRKQDEILNYVQKLRNFDSSGTLRESEELGCVCIPILWICWKVFFCFRLTLLSILFGIIHGKNFEDGFGWLGRKIQTIVHILPQSIVRNICSFL